MPNKINTQNWTIPIILALATLTLVACSGPDDLQMVQAARNYLSEQNVREAALELRGALQKTLIMPRHAICWGRSTSILVMLPVQKRNFGVHARLDGKRMKHRLGWPGR